MVSGGERERSGCDLFWLLGPVEYRERSLKPTPRESPHPLYVFNHTMATPHVVHEDGTHSHLHFALGTTISVADVATFGTAIYILSMSLSAFLTWKLQDFTIQEQAGILLLIAVCLYLSSRLVIFILRQLHKGLTHWEELAATMRKEDVHWFRRMLLTGVQWATWVPADLPKVRDFFVSVPSSKLAASVTQQQHNDYVFEEEGGGSNNEEDSVSVAPPTPKQQAKKYKAAAAAAMKTRPPY